jgi:adenylate cyclase
MALEIERKFLVLDDSWREGVVKTRVLRQGYLMKNGFLSIRIRIDGTESATLTIKTAEPGITRHEFEYPIPVADAEHLLLRRVGAVIDKVRHIVPRGPHTWEIDVFEGANAGLIVAEVELSHANEQLDHPPWLGPEVTDDRRYFNADLARLPYSSW